MAARAAIPQNTTEKVAKTFQAMRLYCELYCEPSLYYHFHFSQNIEIIMRAAKKVLDENIRGKKFQ